MPHLHRIFAALDNSARLEDVLVQNARTELERLASSVPPSRIEKVHVVFGTAWDANHADRNVLTVRNVF